MSDIQCPRILQGIESLCLECIGWNDFLSDFADDKLNFLFPNLRNLALVADSELVSRFLDMRGNSLPRKLQSLRLGYSSSSSMDVDRDLDSRITKTLRKLPKGIKFIQFNKIIVRKGKYHRRVFCRPFMNGLKVVGSNFFLDGLADFFFEITN
jgi:hypothetical protein